MRVFVIGAAGGIGRRLARRLTDRGTTVTGMHRNPDQASTIEASGARPVTGDLIADSAEQLATKMHHHDAVVFSAGAHGTGQDQTSLIDGDGLKKAVAAAQRAEISRFILVSVFPDAARGGELGEGFEHYMRVKKTADVHLAATDLDWLIVRPGTLRDEPGTGKVTAGLAIEYGDSHRDDVAAFIDAALAEGRLRRAIVEVTSGPTPAAAAVEQLVRATRC